MAGDFGTMLEPFQDVVGDGVGDVIGLARRGLGTERCSHDAFMKLDRVKRFGWSLALPLDNRDGCGWLTERHYIAPVVMLMIFVT